MTTLEDIIASFNKDVQQAYQVPRARGYNSIPLHQKLDEYKGDGVRVAHDFLSQNKDAYHVALYKLQEMELLDLSIEALVLNAKKGYSRLFSAEELSMARSRLGKIDPAYKAPGDV